MPILIVEDNAVSAKLAECLLQKAGYKTVVAQNGKEALANLPTIRNLQLIITDFMMPEMDGLEFIAKTKALPAYKDIPIIIVSAHHEVTTVRKARSLGCDCFLVKPVDKHQLLERVQHVLRDQPVVLREKAHIMNILKIAEEEYYDLVGMLTVQVSAALPIVILEQAESAEPVSGQLNHLLAELAESASLLGADKFSMLHSRLVEKTSLTRAQLPAITAVLHDLEAELATNASPYLDESRSL